MSLFTFCITLDKALGKAATDVLVNQVMEKIQKQTVEGRLSVVWEIGESRTTLDDKAASRKSGCKTQRSLLPSMRRRTEHVVG